MLFRSRRYISTEGTLDILRTSHKEGVGPDGRYTLMNLHQRTRISPQSRDEAKDIEISHAGSQGYARVQSTHDGLAKLLS